MTKLVLETEESGDTILATLHGFVELSDYKKLRDYATFEFGPCGWVHDIHDLPFKRAAKGEPDEYPLFRIELKRQPREDELKDDVGDYVKQVKGIIDEIDTRCVVAQVVDDDDDDDTIEQAPGVQERHQVMASEALKEGMDPMGIGLDMPLGAVKKMNQAQFTGLLYTMPARLGDELEHVGQDIAGKWLGWAVRSVPLDKGAMSTIWDIIEAAVKEAHK